MPVHEILDFLHKKYAIKFTAAGHCIVISKKTYDGKLASMQWAIDAIKSFLMGRIKTHYAHWTH